MIWASLSRIWRSRRPAGPFGDFALSQTILLSLIQHGVLTRDQAVASIAKAANEYSDKSIRRALLAIIDRVDDTDTPDHKDPGWTPPNPLPPTLEATATAIGALMAAMIQALAVEDLSAADRLRDRALLLHERFRTGQEDRLAAAVFRRCLTQLFKETWFRAEGGEI
jgi:hypothetical protein